MIAQIPNIEVLLESLFSQHLILFYFISFLIIFIETGIVIAPFLPGDSLLFLVGALISRLSLQGLFTAIILLSFAAILGDSLNYAIGKFFGKAILKKKWINPKHIDKTENFYKRYGVKAIILSRFIPIVRTITPFFAGLGKMQYSLFFRYNVFGGILWVLIFVLAGFFFGSIPLVKNNIEWFMIGIIILSILPGIIAFLNHKRKSK